MQNSLSSYLVSIVVLNWSQKETTAKSLNVLLKNDMNNRQLVVVDNASQDGSPSFLSGRFPQATLLRNQSNLGYAGGNNVGIRYALQHKVDFVLILNNDTIVSPTLIDQLVQAMITHSSVGIAGPKTYVLGTNKVIYATRSRFFKPLAQPLFEGFMKEDKGQFDRQSKTDFVPGSCMLVRREVFEKVGLLSEDFFLLFEDIEFCLRARKMGYKCFYAPKAVIWHQLSGSIGYHSPRHLYYLNRNRCMIARKFNSTFIFLSIFMPYFVFKKLIWEAGWFLMAGRKECAAAIYKGFLDFMKGTKGKVDYFD